MEKYLKVGILLTLMTLLPSITYAVPRELFEEWSLDLRDSIGYLEKEIEAHPENYRLRFVLGTLYFELGVAKIDINTNEVAQASLLMLGKAEKEFKEVLKLNKNDSLSYYYLGHISTCLLS
jgi:tetratricopeptide (TPR) repeat protein